MKFVRIADAKIKRKIFDNKIFGHFVLEDTKFFKLKYWDTKIKKKEKKERKIS